MKRKSLFIKIYSSFILFLVIPIVVFGVFLGFTISTSFQEEVIESSLSKIQSVRNTIDAFLIEVKTLALDMSVNPALDTLTGIGGRVEKKNVDHVFAILDSVKLLSGVALSNQHIQSVYLYCEPIDLVLTSGKDIIERTNYWDTSWVELTPPFGSFPFWIGPRAPLDPEYDEGFSTENFQNFDSRIVVSLVSPLTTYVTTLPGTIVVNITIIELLKMMRNEYSGTSGESYIYDTSSANMLGAEMLPDESNLLNSFQIQEVLESGLESGFIKKRDNGNHDIVFFAKSEITDWVFLKYNRYSAFYGKVRVINTLFIAISILLIIGGIGISFFISRWLYNPVKQLVNDIQTRSGIDISSGGNDITILSEAFTELRQQESALVRLIERSKREARDHILTKVLHGTDEKDEFDASAFGFTHSHYFCAVSIIDNLTDFEHKYSIEQRHYIKELILKIANKVFGDEYLWSALQYDSDKLVYLFNLEGDSWPESVEILESCIRTIQLEVFTALQIDISFSLGSLNPGKAGINNSFHEAVQGLKYRLVEGGRCFIKNWEKSNVSEGAISFSVDRTRIFNYLKLGAEEKTQHASNDFFNKLIVSSGGYYKSLQAVNMLLANIISHLLELHIDPIEIFGIGKHPFEELSSFQTFDEIRTWFDMIFKKIVTHQDLSVLAGKKYIVRIVDFIDQHYTKDLAADDVAEKVGMSYSHMRKVFREQLKTTFHDYLNKKRIEKAKEQLKSTGKTLNDIALGIGYNNVQSFTRFFKKYEGITPGDYRRIH